MTKESKYISVENAVKTTWMVLDGLGYAFDENPQLKETISAVFDTAPAADVRPVVLCRDCKWYEINELKKDGTEDRRYKPSVCMLAEQRREPNHFCAGGEKREES